MGDDFPAIPPPGEIAAFQTLERRLLENHLPFWLLRLKPDEQGYYLDPDHRLEAILGLRTLRAVAQCLTLWFCSRLSRSPYASQASQDLARAGFDYMQKHLWDPLHGGVFRDRGQCHHQ